MLTNAGLIGLYSVSTETILDVSIRRIYLQCTEAFRH